MKIRDRITNIFTFLMATLLLVIFLFIYFISEYYTEKEFYHRLQERAVIAGQTLLKSDEVTVGIYDEIRKKHMRTLPNEKEFIIPVEHELFVSKPKSDNPGNFIFFNHLIEDLKELSDTLGQFPPSFYRNIIEEKYSELKVDNTFYAGIPFTDNEGDFIIVISAIDKYGSSKLENLRNLLIFIYLISLIFIYFVGLYYSKQVLAPISEITKKANEIKASNLHMRLAVGNNDDELDRLATTINEMLDRLETSFVIQNTFISNASHELKNPLTAIMGETDITLERSRSEVDYIKSFRRIEKEASRLDVLINSLLSLASTGGDGNGLFIESIRVDELIFNIKSTMDDLNPDNKIVFDFTKLPEDDKCLIIKGNTNLLKMVLINIIDNACKFSSNKEVVIKMSVVSDCVKIKVEDGGIGVPTTELKNIIEPFYRASNAKGYKGSGIGLPLAKKILKLHGGTMQLKSREGSGTVVTITIPNIKRKDPVKD